MPNPEMTMTKSIDASIVADRIEMHERLAASPAAKDTSHAEFLAYMSHELRTPLNAILGFTQVMKMKEEFPGLQEKRDDYIEMVDDSAQHLLRVTLTMLSYLERICELEQKNASTVHRSELV